MELLKQRYNYATIELIRDNSLFDVGRYSGLDLPEQISVNTEIYDDLDELFNVKTSSHELTPIFKNQQFESIKLEPFPKKGAKTKYYYSDKEKEYISFQKVTKKPFYTTKERHIKRHYANPFASIEIQTHERSVTIENNKLYIRSYKQRKWRQYNWKYFRKTSKVETFSIDLETGNFVIGDINNSALTKTKRFRKNSFSTLEILLSSYHFFNKKGAVPKDVSFFDEYNQVFNDTELLEVISQYVPNLPKKQTDVSDKNEFLKAFIDFFVTKKRIKVPNEYYGLIRRYYPTEKFLKKNGRKLVQSILDSFHINSKLTVKILHENPDINLQDFACFCSLFDGDFSKYVGNLSPEILKVFVNKDAPYYGTTPLEQRGIKHNRLVIENTEKENIIKIVNSLTQKSKEMWGPINNLYGLFKDHFEMIEKIREYDPNMKMTATNYDDFHIEHIELSKMVRLIKKGWTTEYQFDNRMVRLVEEEIVYVHKDLETYVFKPQILKREEEYVEEGTFMHHCVATYANKESSIIISLRTNGGSDRVTCEFSKKTGECYQERHFCNRIPPEHFEQALKTLKERVKRFANQRLLDHIDIKKVKIKINGKEVLEQSPRNELGFFVDDALEF